MSEPIYVERELEALRERVRGIEAQNSDGALTPLQKAIASVNANWYVSAQLPAPERAPLLWRVAFFARRLVRRALMEILNTVVKQQNAFNADVARALTELARENAGLRERITELEKLMTDAAHKD